MKLGRAVLGLSLVAVGTLFILDRADVLQAGDLLLAWWPVAIVALGIWHLAFDRKAVLGGTIIVVLGLVLLGFTTGLVGTDVLRLGWTITIVILGLWLLAGRPVPGRRGAHHDEVDAFVAIGSSRATPTGRSFRGGSATVVVGQLVIDLTGAQPAPGGADLSATVLLGGLDLVVPPGWRVRIRGLPLLGGWDDTTRPDAPADAPEVRVAALVVMGGIEVRYADRWEWSGSGAS